MPLPRGWPLRVRSAVIQTISLVQTSLTHAHSVAANSVNARIRLKEENDQLHQEILLLREESRIKDARMEQIPAQRRSHYPPVERLAILEPRDARRWSLAEAAARFLVSPLTIASWTNRLDEEGADALMRIREPVNRFPEFVGYLVRRLKVLCPSMGKKKMANVLCRAGLHLGPATIRRMLRETKRSKPTRPSLFESDGSRRDGAPSERGLHCDLTTVPTALGFWVPWSHSRFPRLGVR